MALEHRVDRLERALVELAEGQARLTDAQARTEAAVQALAREQARLAEAQARTEKAIEALAQQVGQLAQQVGRLSDTIGFTLEDLARELTPAYLAQHYGIRVTALERRFFPLDGEEVEIDFYGEGVRDGQAAAIVGEVRSRIYGRDVESAAAKARRLASQVTGVPVPVLFGFVIHPSAREAAERTGAIVISSMGR